MTAYTALRLSNQEDTLMVVDDDATLLLQLVGADPMDIMHVTFEGGQRFFFERSTYCSHYDIRAIADRQPPETVRSLHVVE